MHDLFHAAVESEGGKGSVVGMESEDSSSDVGGLDGSPSEPRDEFLTPSPPQDVVL